ncbi:putative zinc-binding metallopeptidase [uncultured Tenacibaculum sp.]|uniref:putative zinc-binding metallopeptidase n=1 Tax=uncultured Tenacibaculum sp. TaxID=174713 RepID=UPI00261F0C0D|nr:putative zinc-binding metallopeptidase [uncultured Tenacibaculum sp.]
MKKIKRLIIPLFIVLSILVINSCNNDEAIIIPSSTADNSNDSNSEDTSNQEQGNDGEITLYKIDNDNISKIKDYKVTGEDLEYQKDIVKHNQIWDLVKKIVPLNQRKKMGEFLIYNGTTSGSAGFVVQLKKDLSSWKMGIAINYAFQGSFNAGGQLAYTIIHEFGHVLTLNDTQLDASITTENCKNYFPGEGCAKEDSYINELHANYWKDIWTEYEVAKKDQESQQKFYEKHKDRFVTQYASTNPPEDIAEVFATFITKKEKPAGNTIAEKKILLMYKRNELIEFKNHIRKNLQLRGRGNSLAFELPEPGKWKQANTIGNPYKTKCRHR